MPGLLLPPADRRLRHLAKQHAALRFLNQTVYSVAETLGRVMGLHAVQPAYRALHGMERERLITRGEVQLHGVKFRLYGITPHGQAVAEAEVGAPRNDRYFLPSRVPVSCLVHFLGLQKLHLAAVDEGWREWHYCDIEEAAYANDQPRPDAVARDRTGVRWAIEYERTLKTPKRYPEILARHLKAIKAGRADRVVWVCDTEPRMEHLRKTILAIKEVPVTADKMVVIEPRHRARLSFAAIRDFPLILQSTRDPLGAPAFGETTS